MTSIYKVLIMWGQLFVEFTSGAVEFVSEPHVINEFIKQLYVVFYSLSTWSGAYI